MSVKQVEQEGRAPAVTRGQCPTCQGAVLVTQGEMFDLRHVRMLVVLAFPELGGKKRVALGPCQEPPKPPHHDDEEPVLYFGHVRHRCETIATNRAYKNGLMKALEIVRAVKPEDICEYLEEQIKEAHESKEERRDA